MTESPPSDFSWGHPQTSPCYPCSSPFWPLLPNPISAPLQHQFSLIGLCFSSGSPPSPGGTFWLLGCGLPLRCEPHLTLEQWYYITCSPYVDLTNNILSGLRKVDLISFYFSFSFLFSFQFIFLFFYF